MGRGVERNMAATSASSSSTANLRELIPKMQSPASTPNSDACVPGAGEKSTKKSPLKRS
eukprot:CAMPEP_0171706660 /NCGR_PEP_ID=MMETSP0991-20121206/13869_1 /TAXON_ID=483369 /ORGANISM="non described non described, Strain CCMP2098" /LENGTH=58 /DNA_ID=CAMNT_0012296327 /DNA_START=223 /DNA_END=399 /DNA_ORIENTATION=+